ncbi:MAG: transposase [Verrucomicrobiales bacterium]|nr:transposase [Verrucomicrobiales bacterium]
MRKIRKFLLGPTGQTNYYHVVSRTTGRDILFEDDEKEVFCDLLMRQLKFSGLRALAWCFMGNHFHLLLEVPDKEAALQNWTQGDFIKRLHLLKEEWSSKLLLDEVILLQGNGGTERIQEIADSVKARLFDLSMFMKELKLKMTLAYNKIHGRKGTLWEGPFKSVLLQGAEQGESSDALRMVAAYIDLNPIRAGLAKEPEAYRWCSYAAAVAGVRTARQGLCFAVTGKTKITWKKVLQEYRCLLYSKGEKVVAETSGCEMDTASKGKAGFSDSQIQKVLSAGGRLPLAVALRCRVRYFSDGAVLGNQNFVDDFFVQKKEYFGKNRDTGARKLSGAEWGDLRVLRDLKKSPIHLKTD